MSNPFGKSVASPSDHSDTMNGSVPNWAVEIWLLVLLPAFLAMYGVLTVLAKSLADIQQTEQLRRDVVRLRHTYNERTKQLAHGRGDDNSDVTIV